MTDDFLNQLQAQPRAIPMAAAVPAGTHAIRGRTGDIEVFRL